MILEHIRKFCRELRGRQMTIIVSGKVFEELESELDDLILNNERDLIIKEGKEYSRIKVKIANCLVEVTSEEEFKEEKKEEE